MAELRKLTEFASSLCEARKAEFELLRYCSLFKDLTLFLSKFGAIFSFVTSDVQSKISILEKYCTERGSTVTVRRMIEFEVQQNLTHRKGSPKSASRTILRLHRALEFIILFIDKLAHSQEEDHPSTLALEAYNNTLYPHHNFLVRNAVPLALYTLPNRTAIFKKIFEDSVPDISALKNFVEPLKQIHAEPNEVFIQYQLLNLP